MVLHIGDGTFNEFRVVYYRRNADFLNKLVPCLAFSVRPVVDIEKRIPTEYEIGIRLLLDIWFESVDVEFLRVIYCDPVLCKTIFTILQDTCSAAGYKGKNSRYCYDDVVKPFHYCKSMQIYLKVRVSQNLNDNFVFCGHSVRV